MPFTFNGFGTMYYGNRDKADDGSYVTTLWIVALFVPVFPLASYRIRPLGDSREFRLVGVPGRYAAQKTSINGRQVARTNLGFWGTMIVVLMLACLWMFR